MQSSELILNADGSIYHLHLHPEEVAPTIITVGDQNRVAQVSKHFDTIEIKKSYREFTTHTGILNGKRLTVISTGIGTDNVDIVINELDALFNIDLATRQVKSKITPLTFIRIGTSGGLRSDIPIDSFLISDYAIGLDGLMYFYKNYSNFENKKLKTELQTYFEDISFYMSRANQELVQLFSNFNFYKGITMTCSGFYAPQMRQLRLEPAFADLFERLYPFSFDDQQVTNLEMETAGIYMLAEMLGHRAISLNAILANRKTGEFSAQPKVAVDRLIKYTLQIIQDELD